MTVPAPAKARRERSVTEILLSIVLVLEALLVFFVMLAVFGLDLLPVGVTFGVGLGLMLVFVIAGRVLMRPWGIWFGWALQALLVATGIILTPMYIVGAGFAGIWVYCFITGRRIDSQKAAVRRAS